MGSIAATKAVNIHIADFGFIATSFILEMGSDVKAIFNQPKSDIVYVNIRDKATPIRIRLHYDTLLAIPSGRTILHENIAYAGRHLTSYHETAVQAFESAISDDDIF